MLRPEQEISALNKNQFGLKGGVLEKKNVISKALRFYISPAPPIFRGLYIELFG